MRWEFFSKKEFRKKYPGGEIGAQYTDEAGEHIIDVPKGASTRTRLHELAHAKLGHTSEGTRSYSEAVQREMAADEWMYEKLGKGMSIEEVIDGFAPLVKELYEKGYRLNGVFSWMVKEVEEAGFILDQEDKSYLWRWLKKCQQLWRGSK